MLSPRLEILQTKALLLGTRGQKFIWKITVGVANTGFLPTHVSEMATKISAVLPVSVEITGRLPATGLGEGAETSTTETSTTETSTTEPTCIEGLDNGPLRVTIGQLSGRLSTRIEWSGSDGTPDRALVTFMVVAEKGVVILATASHQRAGTTTSEVALPVI